MTTVFVSGCFDQLHCGHVAFLKAARTYGDRLVVAIGSDDTITKLKKRSPLTTEAERVFMVESLGCVDIANISFGSGYLDFQGLLKCEPPGVFVVNHDGDRPEKRALCESLGWRYEVINIKSPDLGLPMRSTTAIRRRCIPYRIDLAGGWLDQPSVPKPAAGGQVLVACVEPDQDFAERSGMATSTRNRALDLFGDRWPYIEPTRMARLLSFDDDAKSGSQDAFGIALPGVNSLVYHNGSIAPSRVKVLSPSEDYCAFIERHVSLIPLWPRPEGFDPYKDSYVTEAQAAALADASAMAYGALWALDLGQFAIAVTLSFQAQRAMFPAMVDDKVQAALDTLPPEVLGHKLTGAGGGGYILAVSESPIPNGIALKIRRPKV